MASVNKVIIVGNVGRDPEIRTFPSGDKVANLSIATTDRWRDKNTGENRESTEWHRIIFNGKLADIVEQYVRKGSQLYIEGSLRTRKWTDQASGQERYATEIRADTMQMLGTRQGGGQGDSGYGNDEYGDSQGTRQQQRQGTQRQPPQQRQGGQGTGQQRPPQQGGRNSYADARGGYSQAPNRASSSFPEDDGDIPF